MDTNIKRIRDVDRVGGTQRGQLPSFLIRPLSEHNGHEQRFRVAGSLCCLSNSGGEVLDDHPDHQQSQRLGHLTAGANLSGAEPSQFRLISRAYEACDRSLAGKTQ
ncbi:hypothetical protein [Pseudarthrobacter sulfonivorans]|uniref:hypothetical protein n=1 Tax=Pseudarthrobacter sulfonivorans TaxID=121292 RepID=UPI00168A4D3C|nr:hypothetical protein [Pseudarthrobacter sulfonivorans]